MYVMNSREDELLTRLLSDLSAIGLPVYEVDVFLRPYSKTFFGRYFPVIDERRARAKIYIYPYEYNRENAFYDYDLIFQTGVHEFIHHVQYVNRSFVRRKGVMHDVQFWKLYNHYLERAYRFGIIEKRGEVVEQQYATV